MMKHYKVEILSRWWLAVIVLDFRFHLRRFVIKKMLDPRLLSQKGADSKTQYFGNRIFFYGAEYTLFERYFCPSLVA